jgi:hypothetical protein
MEKQGIVPFIIEKNADDTYAVIENPETDNYGVAGWLGEKVVRSPFASAEAARQKELEIAKFWGFEVVEITAGIRDRAND